MTENTFPAKAQDLEGFHIDPKKRLNLMKSNFAQFATKVDFLMKNDGYQYVLGYFNKSHEDKEWRIWKSLRDIHKSDEYLFETDVEEEAKARFKSIIDEDFGLNKKLAKDSQ